LAYQRAVANWIEIEGCLISERDIKALDAGLTTAALAVGKRAREGELLLELTLNRDRACQRIDVDLALPSQIRYWTIMEGDCSLGTPESKARIEKLAINTPVPVQSYQPTLLQAIRNGSLSSSKGACIIEALSEEFFEG